MMDVSQDSSCVTTTDFDMEVLTSMTMTNTDLIVRLIKDQFKEASTVKNQLSSLNASAIRMKNCYITEKSKNDRIENENRELQMRLNRLKEQRADLNKNLINMNGVHEQEVADLENQLADVATLLRQFINQGNILQKNHISNKENRQHYSKAKEFLTKRGESVEDVKICLKTKITKANVTTMTDEINQSKPLSAKTFYDKSTMHCPMVSTATRGTMTSTFVEKIDVATNYPEPISVEEILQIMTYVPPLITPIDDIHTPTVPLAQIRNVGTITRIRNVRRKVDYVKHSQSEVLSPTPLDYIYNVEKQENIMLESSNVGCPISNQWNLPINRKLTNLWQIVGEMMFSMVGNGQLFDNSLIDQNLYELRRAIVVSQQTDFDDLPANKLYSSVPNVEHLRDTPWDPAESQPSNYIVQPPATETFTESSTRIPKSFQPSPISNIHPPVEIPLLSVPSLYNQKPQSEVLKTASSTSTIECERDCTLKSQLTDELTLKPKVADHVFKIPSVAAKRKVVDQMRSGKRLCKTKRKLSASTESHLSESIAKPSTM